MRTFRLSILLLALLGLTTPALAQPTFDPTDNAKTCVVASGFNSTATSITVATGCGATLPTPPFNMSVCNVTDYPGCVSATTGIRDPDYEVLRVTVIVGDTLTLTARGTHEGTSAANHNTGGKTYWLSTFTAKTINDITSGITAVAGSPFVTTATTGNLSAESVLTGTSNQVIVTGATLSTPQNIHTAADPQFDSLGLGVAADGTSGSIKFATNSAGNNASIFTYSASSTNTGISLYPDGAAGKSWFLFGRSDTTADTAPDRNQSYMRIFAPTGANSLFGAGYYNSVITFGAFDGTNAVRGFELGTEGTEAAGTFGENKLYLWQFSSTGGGGSTVFAIDQASAPNQFRFPWPDASEPGKYVRIGGRQIDTDADGSVSGLDLSPGLTAATGSGNYVKNDSNTRFFHHVLIRPEYKFGASNANTTVAALSVDSTNTGTTGATIIPLRLAHGGTEVARVSSAGNFGSGTQSPLVAFHAQTATVGFLSDVWVDLVQGAGMIVRKGRGTAAAPRRAQSGDDIGVYNARGAFAVNDSTDAAFSSDNSGRFAFKATESHTATGQGAKFELSTAAVGAVGPTLRLTVDETATTIAGSAVIAQSLTLSGDNAPAQIAAATNDYAISATAAVTRVDADQIRAITGMTGGADGRTHTIINDGAADSVLILRREDTGSTAANRFDIPQDLALGARQSATFWYNSTDSRWNLLADTADDSIKRRYLPFDYTDMLGAVGADTLEAHLPWNVALLSTGTQTKVAGDGVRNGILRCTSSTTTNSGCTVTTDVTAYRLAGGEVAEFVFSIDTLTTSTFRLGFIDTATSADQVDGAYIEIPSTGAATCKTSNNSTRTTSSTVATLSITTWYRARVTVDNTAANVTCELFDANGNSLGAQTNSANIPTGAGRETGHGYNATNSGTTAVNLIQMDYMSVGRRRALVR